MKADVFSLFLTEQLVILIVVILTVVNAMMIKIGFYDYFWGISSKMRKMRKDLIAFSKQELIK